MLGAEGVSTIAQLVSVDPVRLSIRSGLPFDFVLGLVDAALLWTYVGGKITVLREFGFKGASKVLLFAEFTGAGGRDLAIAYAGTEADRGVAEASKSKASTSLQAARHAFETDRQLAELRKPRHEAEVCLADPALDAEEVAVLQERWEQLARRLAEVQTTLQEQLDLADRASQAADATAADAAAKAAIARQALRNAPPLTSPLLQQFAAQASITESGFDNIVAQLIRDQYADFIRRVLDVTAVPA